MLADLIDAAGVVDGIAGDTGSGDYTTVAWETGVGKGATITPAKGDTGKTLLIPNAGNRDTDGTRSGNSTIIYVYSSTQSSELNAYRVSFATANPDGTMYTLSKRIARSLRCVRS